VKKFLGCFLCVMLLVFGVAPNVIAIEIGMIDLEKLVSSDQTTWYDDAVTIDDPATIWFQLAVTNTGQVPLTNVEVTDLLLPVADRVIGDLGVSETVAWQVSTFIDLDTTNTASVTGQFDGVIVQDSDSATVNVNNPVPEPTTMLLFGAGLVGLAGFGRKKFKK
jgi:hypothetical protein